MICLIGSAGGCRVALWDGTTTQWGTLREVLAEGAFEGRVPLATVTRKPHVYGVGALASLRGEILIDDSQAWISRAGRSPGEIETVEARSQDVATFLAVATVPRWTDYVFDRPIAWDELESTLALLIDAAGCDRAKPVPFVVEGRFDRVELHVINGRCPMNPGIEAPGAGETLRHAASGVPGRLVGFYTEGPPGVLTHHGSHIHAHALLSAPEQTMGHVDRADVAEGAVIRLPRRP